jgi:deazaflavin-dependent oxidoreductase (nitroreductase family)
MPISPEEAAWNASTIADLREHGGRITTGPLIGSNVLLMTTIGARSHQPRTAPLGYTLDGEQYVVVGSNSGAPRNPDWLRNVQVDPVVTVEAGGETFRARATVAEGRERRRLLDAHIAAIPIFATYEEMTERDLPVVTLTRIE